MRAASLIGPSTRLRLICALLLCCFAVLAARAVHLTVVDMRGRTRGELQLHTVLQLPAPRGMIVDRRGVELAITVEAPSIYAIPTHLENIDTSARALAAILRQEPAKLADKLHRRQRFTFLKRWASWEQARRIEELDLEGVGILKEARRAYPAGALAGKLIGFANIDGVGVRAIEQQEDQTLRGRARTVRVERDARGRLLVADPSLPRDFAGGDVRLTIDAALQAEAEAALERAIDASGARSGAVITIDPKTGDILSLAELPGIDPNSFRELDFDTTRSRAFLDAVEPGSTLKAFLVAGALDAGVVEPGDRIDTGRGMLRVPGKTIRDHRPYGEISVGDALMVSSNVGAVLIGQRLEPRRHYEVLRRFGFGRKTGSGFPQESAGILRSYERWKPVDRATLAFGQGISVTPVQLAAATAALANGGVWRPPRLVAARRTVGGEWVQNPIDPGRRVVSESSARHTLRMLEGVVSATGTGRRAALRGVRVAGKTGTAQKLDVETGRYSHSRYLAWFIGVVPAEDPKLAITVVLDEPQGLASGGGDAAAPLFAEVAAAQLSHFGIVTKPARIRAVPFPTLLAKEKTAPSAASRHEIESTPRGRSARERSVTGLAPASRSSASQPKLRSTAAEGTPASIRLSAATSVSSPQTTRLPQPLRDAAPARFVPDFRGETAASAIHMADQDSFDLELVGDRRGLAVEQHPVPGTVVTGHRPRVRLRFTLGMEEG